MPRHPHFLARARGDVHPGRIVGLSLRATAVPVDGQVVGVTEHLLSWHASGWTRGQDGKDVHWEKDGTDAASAWGAVDYALRRGGVVWAVSHGACRVWGLLGLWEMLEDGRCTLNGRGRYDGRDSVATNADVVSSPGGDGGDGSAPSARVGTRRVRAPAGPVLEDPPTVLRIRRNGRPGTLLIVDIRNYGIDDGPPPGPEQARWARDALCRLDRLLIDNGWGTLCASSGAQAWRIWRTAFADHAVYVHRNKDALDLEGAAYYGGRCECRYIGTYPGRVYHLDYRSLYPSICARLRMPALLERVQQAADAPTDLAAERGSLLIADVKVSTPEPCYPFRRYGDTYYPVGTFYTTLAGPELSHALQRGRVRSLGRSAWYTGEPVLARYVNELWRSLCSARSVGDADISAALKRLLVCLPGRCGQRGYRWEPVKPSSTAPIWGEWWRPDEGDWLQHYRAIAGEVDVEVREDWAPESIPAIAAWVCSAGRMLLWESMEQAGQGNVLYYDTDSLIVNEEGYARLVAQGAIHDNTLGSLRLVRRVNRAEIQGIKHYTLDQVQVCAGLPKGDVLPSAIPGYYWYTQHARGQIHAGHRPCVDRILQRYSRESAYRHGIVGKDGWVKPLEVNE
jgi:hypothetical protein